MKQRITITTKNAATVEGAENVDATRQGATATVKRPLRRFYLRGHHPHSRANLRPRRKGQPTLNPHGRRGAHSLQSELQELVFGSEWRKIVKQTEKTERLLERSVREHLGISLKELERQMYGR
jgi:hypothetical protein